VRLSCLVLAILAGCGGNAAAPLADAPSADAPGDAGNTASACGEFDTTGVPAPLHVTGTLSGNNNVESPSSCAVTNAPYGTESTGPDEVVLVTGLVPGMPYVIDLESTDDLLFYVATGCSTPTGPSSDQCLLFEDATTSGAEVGTFVATSPSVYVVVDYYASHAPPNGGNFTLDVYAQSCTSNNDCSGGEPVCSNGACVECATSFDCADPAASFCDTTMNRCVAGVDMCGSDDAVEPADDGPAGATVLSAGTPVAAHVCSAPSTEADFYAFDVTALGDTWDVTVGWTGNRDLQLELYSATGELLGLSYWEEPERVELTYLPLGRYYALVRESSSSPDSFPQPYTIAATRTPGSPCESSADCAADFGTQLYRGSCQAGACVDLDGSGAVGAGSACDSQSDCAAGLSCPSFYFVANADTRDVCEPLCTNDDQCGKGSVCTTYLQQNFCVQRCSEDLQCPVATGTPPQQGPWARLSCQLATGRCVP
jgi:hypothetical protein